MSCELRVLLASGKDTTRTFPASLTVGDVKNNLLNDWPEDFDKVNSVSELRLIHAGKVLDNSKTLQQCGVSTEQLTNVHLAITPQQPGAEKKDGGSKKKSGSSAAAASGGAAAGSGSAQQGGARDNGSGQQQQQQQKKACCVIQ